MEAAETHQPRQLVQDDLLIQAVLHVPVARLTCQLA
jgi:hypothetical protein